MKKSSVLPLIVPGLICSIMLGFSPASVAATATNLVTICLSATTTTQASKCTKWQYNVYSPTAYIESYPQVSPGPAVWTDPNYDYRLGSSITSTMGVKVCPTALTPGVTFNSANADPCPNNVMVSASTVLPANTYAVTTDADGIIVYQVNTSGVSVVPGGPFVPSPVPHNPESNQSVPVPGATAVDPSGQYLYAVYNLGGFAGAVVYSFKMNNGVPQQLSNSGYLAQCPSCDPVPAAIIATAQHVYVQLNTSGAEFPTIQVLTTTNGVLTPSPTIVVGNLSGTGPAEPSSFDIDPQEQFLYATVGNTVAIFALNFSTQSATLVSVEPQQGGVTVGAK